MNKHVVGWGKRPGLTYYKSKFVHVKMVKSVPIFIPTKTRAKLCDLGIRITWVHVSRLPAAAPGQ